MIVADLVSGQEEESPTVWPDLFRAECKKSLLHSAAVSDLLLIACKKKQEVLNRPLCSRLKVRQGSLLESRERAAFQKDVSLYRGDVT